MTLSIYDILNKNIDYRKEYKKIKNMFLNEYLLVGQTHDYKYNEVFDAYIMKWKYRGTKCSLEEIIEDIEREIKCGLDPINDCLHLCELILNVREFITYISKKYYLYDMNINIFSDELLIGTIEYILKTLGYSYYKEEDYKVLLIKEEADSINTALIVGNEDISKLVMEYNDFKIVNNVSEKQRILQSLANYIEPNRKTLKEKNAKLEKNLFMAFNKLNIRHNNLDGKKKEEYTSKLTREELVKWYDNIYSLCLISIRLLEIDNQLQPFEDIAKQHFNK